MSIYLLTLFVMLAMKTTAERKLDVEFFRQRTEYVNSFLRNANQTIRR